MISRPSADDLKPLHIQTEPARFAMAAHFRSGLALDPAAQQCNPGRVDPTEALGGQIKSLDERQPVAGTENAFKRGRADIVFQTVKPGRSRRFAQARLRFARVFAGRSRAIEVRRPSRKSCRRRGPAAP